MRRFSRCLSALLAHPDLFALFAAIFGGLVIACGRGIESGKAAPPKGLTVVLGTSPLNFDPRLSVDAASGRMNEVAFRGLLRKGKKADMVAELAQSFEVSADGLVYTFHLRDGTSFHDGRPLTSADVAYTFKSILDPALVSPKLPTFAVIKTIETPDPLSVVFRLEKPYPSLAENMTQGIVPEGTTTAAQNARPIGAGPFKVTRVERDERITLEPFAGYHAGKPPLAALAFKIVPDATVRGLEMERGSIGLSVNQLPYELLAGFAENPKFTTMKEPGGNYTYLAFNLEDPALRKLEVRRAIALAIDRRAILDAVYNGYGVLTESILPPFHWAHLADLPKLTPNPAEARRLLDRAGYPDPDGDGPKPRLTLTYKTSTDEARIRQAEVLQAQLAGVGIAIDIRSFEFATFFTDIKNGKFQLYSLTWTGIADPEIFYNAFHSNSIPPSPGANRGRYRSREADDLIMRARHGTNREERIRQYHEIQRLLARDLPYMSLWNEINVAVMPVSVKGFELYPSGELYSLESVRVE